MLKWKIRSEQESSMSLLKFYTYLAMLPKEQKMKGQDKRKMYPKYLGLLADRSNCLLNDLEPFDGNKVVYICVEYSQALDNLLSGFSSLSVILNSVGILTIGKQ